MGHRSNIIFAGLLVLAPAKEALPITRRAATRCVAVGVADYPHPRGLVMYGRNAGGE